MIKVVIAAFAAFGFVVAVYLFLLGIGVARPMLLTNNDVYDCDSVVGAHVRCKVRDEGPEH